MKILVFGGTAEARNLADRLVGDGHEVTTSLAGRTRSPRLPQGNIRTGGFGDKQNLATYLNAQKFNAVVDATHPYAAQMSATLGEIVPACKLPLVQLVRPEWSRDGADWIDIASIEHAAQHLTADSRVLVTTGHKGLSETKWPEGIHLMVRLIEPPERAMPSNTQIIIDRPPYALESEFTLMQAHGITHLLTKNSGGAQTHAKIAAATKLGITILMVRRPNIPSVGIKSATVDEALSAFYSLEG